MTIVVDWDKSDKQMHVFVAMVFFCEMDKRQSDRLIRIDPSISMFRCSYNSWVSKRIVLVSTQHRWIQVSWHLSLFPALQKLVRSPAVWLGTMGICTGVNRANLQECIWRQYLHQKTYLWQSVWDFIHLIQIIISIQNRELPVFPGKCSYQISKLN